jgi:uncharacterized protein (DUF1501 family)
MPRRSHETAYTRRDFLSSGLLMASASLAVPAFLQNSAIAMTKAFGGMSNPSGIPEGHILVVVQLSGGNDGLNTVVPFGMPEYHKARTAIAITEKEALKFGKFGEQGVGLHPRLDGIMSLYDEGLCGIVQGVGYPNPNRSHFKSMDIWHTADLSATGDGWLGKYFDSECCGVGKGESGTPENAAKPAEKKPQDSSPPGIAIGRTTPNAMQGRLAGGIAFESAQRFKWVGPDVHKSLARPYDELNRRGQDSESAGDSNSDFLLRTALDAQVSSDLIRKAVSNKTLTSWPNGDLANQLKMVSQMIRAGLKTRVYYVSLGGFDTHAGQGGANGRHAQLMAQLGSSLKAFYAELKAQENDGRVLTLAFSEFGRRVQQNASNGTDHGTAAPLFLFGPMVQPGILSNHPSMKQSDLDQGDLKFNVDFRSVYASVLDQWLKGDSKKVLGETFKAAPVLRKA